MYYNTDKILERVLDSQMKLEGKSATTLFSSLDFDCFFRINNDGTNQKSTMIMYYRKDAPIYNGTIIVFRNEKFIVLNQETIENDVYYKSMIVKANGEITTSDFSVVGLPFYSGDMNYGNASSGSNLSIIDGRMEVVTEDCDLSHKLKINDCFNAWGRTWEIQNLYFVDGIAHVVLQVTADKVIEHKYSLSLAPIEAQSATVGDMINVFATAFIDGEEDESAELTWHTSDKDVAIISNDGVITFMAPGNVTFSVSWDDHNLIDYSNAIECVAASGGDDTLALYVAETKELYCDFENDPIQYYVAKGGEKVTDIPITFIAEYPASAALEKKIAIVVTENSVLVNPDDTRFLGKTFTLIAKNEEYGLEARQEIKCVSVW